MTQRQNGSQAGPLFLERRSLVILWFPQRKLVGWLTFLNELLSDLPGKDGGIVTLVLFDLGYDGGSGDLNHMAYIRLVLESRKSQDDENSETIRYLRLRPSPGPHGSSSSTVPVSLGHLGRRRRVTVPLHGTVQIPCT